MSRGKKYRRASPGIDRQHLYSAGRGRRPGQGVGQGHPSTRRWSWLSGWAWTPGRPTRSCGARFRCRPAPGGRPGWPCSPPATRRPQARAAGADVVGADDLVARVADEGFLDFDVAIATPDLMGQVGTLGRVLGPRGLMPNPKTGTVTDDVERAVAEFKGGRVEYRTDKVGNVHLEDRQGVFRPCPAPGEPSRSDGGDPPGQAGLGQGPLRAGGDPVLDHGPGCPRSTRCSPGRPRRTWPPRPEAHPTGPVSGSGACRGLVSDLSNSKRTAVDLRCTGSPVPKGPRRVRLTRRSTRAPGARVSHSGSAAGQ